MGGPYRRGRVLVGGGEFQRPKKMKVQAAQRSPLMSGGAIVKFPLMMGMSHLRQPPDSPWLVLGCNANCTTDYRLRIRRNKNRTLCEPED
ncbi:hypothetical protein RRG08_021139 [Elysia crispata]|uniref:Uncharacterized protein n=1 Tax=Elysia crispata TaxID=231223 RepID=A0AAE0Z765_9GAST|nr:hypothetical protein RRG08_021139 [Elysia crispata]